MQGNGQGFCRLLKIEPQAAHLARVRQFVEEVAQEAAPNLNPERLFDLKVAVSEACANAIEHAGDCTSYLEVCATLKGGRLTFTVTDTGLFRPPCLSRETCHSRGLGLPLMVALMDEVQFSRVPQGGTAVSLSIFVDPVASDRIPQQT